MNKIQKLLNWEYWPSSMFYLPNVPYAFYLAYKAKHPAFFTAVNPSIKSSGNGTESKYATLQLIPQAYRPKSVLVSPNTSFEEVLGQLADQKIEFPLIAKPDIGFRGLLVHKIKTTSELQRYLTKYPIATIIQEFIEYKNECGIFYYRNPFDNCGQITSITLKKFLTVIGDGTSTVEELILKDERAKLYRTLIEENEDIDLSYIPRLNEEVFLSVIGNHCKGTQFINGSHLVSQTLQNTFDKLNKSIDGWYYGRLDIKYNSFEELEQGINFKILEINGIIAEPTHIYDSNNYTYFKALKEIRKHWKNLYQIAITNHKKLNTPYKSSMEFAKEILHLKNYISTVKNLN